jgi:hypothetical protein
MTGEPPKNKHRGTPGFLIKFFQLALYIPIQVAFIPIAIVGLIDAIFKEMRNSKKLGTVHPGFAANSVLFGRSTRQGDVAMLGRAVGQLQLRAAYLG